MSTELIQVSIADGIATLTLNRPEKRNALNGHMVAALLQHLNEIEKDHSVRVLMLGGEGPDFCAGGDIDWMQKMASEYYETNVEDAMMLAKLLYQLYHFPLPTLAVTHGACMGGGIGLVAACDMVLASSTAYFAFSEVKIGMTPSTISPYVMAAIGERPARYYFLTGEKFDAIEAHRLGLVNRMVDAPGLMQAATEIVNQLKANSPNAIKSAKKLIYSVGNEKITEALSRMTAEHLADSRMSEEAKEGLNAFLEKRAPRWRNE